MYNELHGNSYVLIMMNSTFMDINKVIFKNRLVIDTKV